MKRTNRFVAWGLAAMLGIGICFTPITAQASEEGRRNTALGLGAAAAALLLTQKNKVPGLITAGAALLAFGNADRDRHHWNYDRNRDHDDYWRDHDYRNHDYRDHGDYHRR